MREELLTFKAKDPLDQRGMSYLSFAVQAVKIREQVRAADIVVQTIYSLSVKHIQAGDRSLQT